LVISGIINRSVTGRIITPGGEIVTALFERIEEGGYRVVETFFVRAHAILQLLVMV